MYKDEIIINSLKDIFENSSLEQIRKSDMVTKNGSKFVTFNITSYPNGGGGEIMYQMNLYLNKGVVTTYLNKIQMVPGRGNSYDQMFFDLKSKNTKFGDLYFSVPAGAWDIMRNGMIGAVMDYVEKQVEYVFAA